MKLMKRLLMVALMMVPFAMQLNAQTVVAAGSGSSALFLELGQGIYAAQPSGTACAWTSKDGVLTDSRVASPYNTEVGNKTWVVYTTGASGTCANPGTDSNIYLDEQVDSTIGDRCLFAQPSCTVSEPSAALTTGAGVLPGITDTALPQTIHDAIQGVSVNYAATDVLPVDAKFATWQTLQPCNASLAGTMTTSLGAVVAASQFSGNGYGPGPVGTNITSQAGTIYHVIDFNVAGNDPISGNPVPAYTVTPVGATPELVIVQTTNASGFGSSSVTNITRGTLTGVLTGLFATTADVVQQQFAGTTATYYPLTAWIREPLSGTYRVMEHSIANSIEFHRSQELINCNTSTGNANTNPFSFARTVNGVTSHTYRAIGTGEMITQVRATTDGIGYAFWGAGNFAGKTNLKYLYVDGVDPLGTGGVIPTAAGTTMNNVTLANVQNGGYSLWTMLRLVSNTPAGLTAAQALASAAQAQVSFGPGATQPDFIPYSQMTVFHGHYTPIGTASFSYGPAASDGVCGASGAPEAGGDAGGTVFSMQAGADYCVLKGNYNAAGGVSITNAASIGVRQ